MKNLLPKMLLTAGIGILLHSNVSAQENLDLQHVEPLWNVSFEGGVTLPATDVKSTKPGAVFGLGLGYHPLRYLQVNVSLQKGWLKEGENTNDGKVMNYSNNYFYGSATARLFPFKIAKKADSSSSVFTDYLYVGTGIAMINSNVKSNPMNSPDYGFINAYKGTDVLIPIELGASYPVWKSEAINQQLNISLNLRHHFSFTDKLDGYEPTIESNKKNDVFNQILIGISYHF